VETILMRLRSKGINISLNDSQDGLAFDYNDELYDSLSFDEANALNALIDDSEVEILAHLQQYNYQLVEIIKSTNEVVGRLAGQRVEIEGKVIEINELCVIVEAFGILFQIDDFKSVIENTHIGEVYQISGIMTGIFSSHTKPTYILVEHYEIKHIKTEAF